MKTTTIALDRQGLKFIPSAWTTDSAPLPAKLRSRMGHWGGRENRCPLFAYANGFRTAKPFMVNLYGSHPNEDNDDCWTGEDFATIEEARIAAVNWNRHFGALCTSSTTHVEILERVGDMTYEQVSVTQVRSNKEIAKMRRRDAAEDRAERSEFAMQQGMAFGVEAFNEAMGWD